MLKRDLSRYLTKTIGAPPPDLKTDLEAASPVAPCPKRIEDDLSAMMLPPGASELFANGIFNDCAEPVKPAWMTRIGNRKCALIGAACAFGVAASAIYAALGLWLYVSIDDHLAQQAEPIALLSTQDSENAHADTRRVLENIQQVQQDQVSMHRSRTSEQGLLAQGAPQTGLPGEPAGDEKFSMASLKEMGSDAAGRPDPFEPLVQPASAIGAPISDPGQARDVLDSLNFTGFIGDTNSRDKVAIIKVLDPMAGTSRTLIKKAGDSFMVDGERVVLKSISKNSLRLGVNGQTRQLSLSAYQEMSGSSTSTSGTTGSASSPSGQSVSAGATGAGLGNIARVAGEGAANRNPENVQLQEPGQ
jgi:hypothetical protein